MRHHLNPAPVLLFVFWLTCYPFTTSAQPQASKKEAAPLLTIRGVTEKPVTLSAADLEKLPHRSIRVKGQNAEEVTYEGIALSEVLKRAGLDFESNLHGRTLTRYLLAEAVDKYHIVYALPEIDPAFTDRIILLVTKQDGKPLSNEEGPLKIIVPGEKRQTRWMRQVRVLTIADAAERNKKP